MQEKHNYQDLRIRSVSRLKQTERTAYKIYRAVDKGVYTL